jgi:hypothetical protein
VALPGRSEQVDHPLLVRQRLGSDGNVRVDLRLDRRRLGLAGALLPVRGAADERTPCESCDGSQRGTTAQAGAVWGA